MLAQAQPREDVLTVLRRVLVDPLCCAYADEWRDEVARVAQSCAVSGERLYHCWNHERFVIYCRDVLDDCCGEFLALQEELLAFGIGKQDADVRPDFFVPVGGYEVDDA